MSETIASHRVALRARLILQKCLLALSFWGALVAWGLAADDPSAKKADSGPEQRKQQTDEEEFQRLKKQAFDFQNAGKLAEAIAAGEKLVQLVGKLDGADSEAVANWEE